MRKQNRTVRKEMGTLNRLRYSSFAASLYSDNTNEPYHCPLSAHFPRPHLDIAQGA